MTAILASLVLAAIFNAGFARVDITPPEGAYMPGYYNPRHGVGAKTPLVAEAVAFSGQGGHAVVMTVDNLHLTRTTIEAVKTVLKKEIRLPPEKVFIHSTHTHTSAATDSTYYKEIEDAATRSIVDAYGKSVEIRLVELVAQAFKDLHPAEFSIARGEVKPAISFIRRYRMKDGTVRTNPGLANPEVDYALGEADNSVQLVRIVRSGAPDIAMVNFQCHPDTVGGILYDADWPGVLRGTFESAVGDGTRLFFMNGAQGDTNHHQVLSDAGTPRYSGRDGFHVMMGRAIAGAALQLWDHTVPLEMKGPICGKIMSVKIASNKPDARRREAIRLFDEGRKDEIRGFGAMEIMAMCDKNSRARQLMNGPDSFEMPVSALAVGSLAFAGFPGEPFTEIGLKVKAGSPFGMTFIGCLVNDSCGYLPSTSAANEGGYEVVTSKFGAACGDTLIASQLDNLRTLRSDIVH